MNCIALSVEQHGPQHFNCIYLFIYIIGRFPCFLSAFGYWVRYYLCLCTINNSKVWSNASIFLCGTTCGGTTSVRLLRGTLEDGVTHTRQPHTHPRALPPFRLFTARRADPTEDSCALRRCIPYIGHFVPL